MEKKDIWFCLIRMNISEKFGHPQAVMRELGITYDNAVPQSIAYGWQFFGCVIPEDIVLPDYITVQD